jgi:hypothetical protein
MSNYEMIESYIQRAKIERSVYLGQLIGETAAAVWKAILDAADIVLSASRAKYRRNVFTFDV